MQGQRWIVVADSPFLPATGGGEREHLGFVRAAKREGLLALLIVPTVTPLDIGLYRAEIDDLPLIVTPRHTSALRLAHPRLPYVVASRTAPRWLPARARAAAREATGIVVFSYKSHQIGHRLARDLGLPAVLRQHNHEGAYHRSLAAGTPGLRGLVLGWEAWRIERDEVRLGSAPWLSGIADISLADAQARRRTGGLPVVHVPPFAFDPSAVRPRMSEPDSARVLFLGALDIATNVAAVAWFIPSVWPEVLKHCPNARLEVVGRAPGDLVRRLVGAAPAASLHADVADPAPYLAGATVAVNPAVSGSGVNIKVIEYLQAGLPVVSTSLATQGLSLRSGRDLEVHDNAAGFAAALIGLLQDRARARSMAESGQKRVTELLDPVENLRRIAVLLAPC